MGVGQTILRPLRVDSPIKCSAASSTPTPIAPDTMLYICRARCRTFGPPSLRLLFITLRVTSLFRMAQFIDYGDNCSDGPPSTIGDYDTQDDFINDDASDHSSTIFIPNPESPRVSIERFHSSPVVPEGRLRPRQLSIATSRTSPSDRSSSILSEVLLRHRGLSSRPRQALRRSVSQTVVHGIGGTPDGFPSSSSEASDIPLVTQRRRSRMGSPYARPLRQRQREHSSAPSSIQGSEGSYVRLRSVSTLRSVQDALDPREPRDGGENPFEVPNHLRGGELAGLGLPGKRLGSGKPRWCARYFMFTTSQSGYDWPYQRLIDICEALGAKHKISRELHADGGYHFHAFVDFERKFEFENPHKFCVGEPSGRSREHCPVKTHCNILPITRTPFNTWDYVAKYGDVVSNNCERPVARGSNVTRDDMWTGSLAQSNKDEFLKDVRKHSPRDAVLFHKQITSFAHSNYDDPQPQMPVIDEEGVYIHWERYPQIRKWVVRNLTNPIETIRKTSRGLSYPAEVEAEDAAWFELHRPDGKRSKRPKSLIVYGDSRLGKTVFSRNLGPHVHWQRDFNLKKLINMGVDNVDYAIFDDIAWDNAALKKEGFKAWLGGNKSFDVSDKFQGKFTLNWGKPCILLTNKDPWEGLDLDDSKWLRRNVIYVALGPDDPDRSNAIASADVFEGESDIDDY